MNTTDTVMSSQPSGGKSRRISVKMEKSFWWGEMQERHGKDFPKKWNRRWLLKNEEGSTKWTMQQGLQRPRDQNTQSTRGTECNEIFEQLQIVRDSWCIWCKIIRRNELKLGRPCYAILRGWIIFRRPGIINSNTEYLKKYLNKVS